MRRKIVLNGPSSLTVSLPTQWIKQNNVSKGDEIEISEEDNNLILTAVNNAHKNKSIELSFDNLNKAARNNILLGLYINGYDEIKINFSEADYSKSIFAYLTSNHLGFEILKQEANYLIVKNITTPNLSEMNNLFRRMFRILIEYMRKISHIMSATDDMTETPLLYKTSIDRYSNYCKRMAMSLGYKKSVFNNSIIDDIQRIAAELSEFLDEIRESDEQEKAIINDDGVFNDLIGFLDDCHNLRYNFSQERYSSLLSSSNKISAKIDSFRQRNDNSCHYEYIRSINAGSRSILNNILLENI